MRRGATASVGAWLALTLTACAGTEVGNPAKSTQIALTVQSTNDDVALSSDTTSGVSVDEVWVVLGDLRFVMDEVCDSGDDSRIDVADQIALSD